MKTPTIAVATIRTKSRHPKVKQTVGAYWSDDIVETLRDATTGILQPYTDLWDDSIDGSERAWYSAFYLLFDFVAYASEGGGAFNSQSFGGLSHSFGKEEMPPIVKSIISRYAETESFGGGQLVRLGR